MRAVLQNEGRVLPELTAEISVKVLLLSLGADQTRGMLPFSHTDLLVAMDFPRVNFDLTVRPGSAPISAFALLVEIWQAFPIMVSLSVYHKNKQQQKLLELNS